jgi:hypothetical protein
LEKTPVLSGLHVHQVGKIFRHDVGQPKQEMDGQLPPIIVLEYGFHLIVFLQKKASGTCLAHPSISTTD